MDKINGLILRNELCWLRTLKIKIEYLFDGINIVRKDNDTTDFNFFIPEKNIRINNCNRISDRNSFYYEQLELLLTQKMVVEPMFDINFITVGYEKEDFEKQKYFIREIEYNDWEYGTREINSKSKFYLIGYKHQIIGRMSTIEDEKIIGIYDYEIFKPFRKKGHGSNFLKFYIRNSDKIYFIQTWSTNFSAIGAYLRAGFKIYENLYRYGTNICSERIKQI